jgi:TolB-like protein
MLATVEPVTAKPGMRPELEKQAAAAGAPTGLSPSVPRRGRLVVAIVLVLAVLGGAWEWRGVWRGTQPAGARLMLAVLPFENLTGDSGQEYLGDGLTEAVITQFGRLNPQRFGVIARTSAMHYKHNPARVQQIGRELNVQYVLEGSLRKEGGTVRVAAQLIRVEDETHTWAREYERELSGLLALQDEIAQEISDEIQIALGDHPASRPAKRTAVSPEQSEAYDRYLKGVYFLEQEDHRRFLARHRIFSASHCQRPKPCDILCRHGGLLCHDRRV